MSPSPLLLPAIALLLFQGCTKNKPEPAKEPSEDPSSESRRPEERDLLEIPEKRASGPSSRFERSQRDLRHLLRSEAGASAALQPYDEATRHSSRFSSAAPSERATNRAIQVRVPTPSAPRGLPSESVETSFSEPGSAPSSVATLTRAASQESPRLAGATIQASRMASRSEAAESPSNGSGPSRGGESRSAPLPAATLSRVASQESPGLAGATIQASPEASRSQSASEISVVSPSNGVAPTRAGDSRSASLKGSSSPRPTSARSSEADLISPAIAGSALQPATLQADQGDRRSSPLVEATTSEVQKWEVAKTAFDLPQPPSSRTLTADEIFPQAGAAMMAHTEGALSDVETIYPSEVTPHMSDFAKLLLEVKRDQNMDNVPEHSRLFVASHLRLIRSPDALPLTFNPEEGYGRIPDALDLQAVKGLNEVMKSKSNNLGEVWKGFSDDVLPTLGLPADRLSKLKKSSPLFVPEWMEASTRLAGLGFLTMVCHQSSLSTWTGIPTLTEEVRRFLSALKVSPVLNGMKPVFLFSLAFFLSRQVALKNTQGKLDDGLQELLSSLTYNGNGLTAENIGAFHAKKQVAALLHLKRSVQNDNNALKAVFKAYKGSKPVKYLRKIINKFTTDIWPTAQVSDLSEDSLKGIFEAARVHELSSSFGQSYAWSSEKLFTETFKGSTTEPLVLWLIQKVYFDYFHNKKTAKVQPFYMAFLKDFSSIMMAGSGNLSKLSLLPLLQLFLVKESNKAEAQELLNLFGVLASTWIVVTAFNFFGNVVTLYPEVSNMVLLMDTIRRLGEGYVQYEDSDVASRLKAVQSIGLNFLNEFQWEDFSLSHFASLESWEFPPEEVHLAEKRIVVADVESLASALLEDVFLLNSGAGMKKDYPEHLDGDVFYVALHMMATKNPEEDPDFLNKASTQLAVTLLKSTWNQEDESRLSHTFTVVSSDDPFNYEDPKILQVTLLRRVAFAAFVSLSQLELSLRRQEIDLENTNTQKDLMAQLAANLKFYGSGEENAVWLGFIGLRVFKMWEDMMRMIFKLEVSDSQRSLLEALLKFDAVGVEERVSAVTAIMRGE